MTGDDGPLATDSTRMRGLLKPLRREAAVVFLFCVVAIAFAAPVLRDIHNWGILDWDFQLHHHAAPRSAILDHAEIPLWNPYNWSGVPMLGHPESRVLAPTFALTLLFGEVIGLKLEILIHLVIGMLGAYLLLRHFEAGRVAASTAAIVFMLSSSYALHLTVGHVWALSHAYLPWAFLFYLKALDELRYSLIASLVLLLTLFGGAPYQFMIILACLAIHSACAIAIGRKDLLRHARLLLVIGIQTFLLGAIKLLPTIELMSAYPRLGDLDTGYTVGALLNALFDRDQTLGAAFAERPLEFGGSPLHEGMYVGLLPLLPFLLGIVSGWRRHAALLATLTLFVWISLGRHAPVDLWSAIHSLPGFDNVRVVQRFGVVVLLIFCVFVGLGMDPLRERIERWTSKAGLANGCAVALATLMLADLAVVSGPIFADAFTIPPLSVHERQAFRQIVGFPLYDASGWIQGRAPRGRRSLSALYPATLANRGATGGYRIVPMPSSAIPATSPDYRGEAFLAASPGKVTLRKWSPNRIVLEVEAPEGGQLVVNQNHVAGWRAHGEPGGDLPVTASDGLLALEVPPGKRTVELYYRPTSFVLGAGVSLTTLLVLLLLAVRRRCSRARPEASSGLSGS